MVSPQLRKRKSDEFERMSNEGTPRKVLAEINAGSGLPVPGWSKSSAKKPGKTRESTQGIDLNVELPSETVDSISTKCFGEASERAESQSGLLKRTKPEQKLYGYAKTYLDSETKRLAKGLRENFSQRDLFVQQCKDLEYKLLNAITATKMKAERIVAGAKDTKNRLASQEKDLTALRKKENAISTELATMKVEHEHIKQKLEVAVTEKHSMDKKIGLFEKEVSFLQDEVTKKTEANKELSQNLEQIRISSEKDRLSLQNQLELQTKGLREEKDQQSREIDELRSKMQEISLKMTNLENENSQIANAKKDCEHEISRLKIALETSAMQISNLESQIKQKDAHLDKTLETFQQNQNFSQERIAATCEEKRLLEIKLDEISQSKSNFELENANLVAKVNELSSDMNRMSTNLSEKEEKLLSVDNELQSSKRQLVETADQLKTAMNQVGSMADQLKELRAELKDSKERFTLEKESLANENQKLETSVENLKAKNEALESELLAMKQTYSENGATSDEKMEQLFTLSKEAELLKRQVMDQSSIHQRLAEAEKQLKETKDKLFESDRARRQLHNEIQDLKGKVRVVARIRPLNTRQDSDGDAPMEESALVCGPEGMELAVKTEHEQSKGTKTREHNFKFDRVFGTDTKQHEMFAEVQSFVQSALDGYNVCLFSYGQTGSGKTYTMTGDHTSDVHRGIIPRAISNIMCHQKELRDKGWTYTLQASFVEIYNESIRDLLTNNSNKLDIRDSKIEINIPGVTKLDVKDQEDVDRILAIASKNRSVAATDLNHESSRSHSVFTLFINGLNTQYNAKLAGSLSMCDLAGSERISRSNVTGDRLKETQAINKSLSALSDVFTSLSKKTAHVPYRNSKLTHMLQPCFAGQGKTMMILNLSSDTSDLNESMCSLRFGSQVNSTELGKAKRQISTATN